MNKQPSKAPKQKICKECGANPAEPNSDYCKKHINTPQQTTQQRFTEAYHRYLTLTTSTEALK